MSDLALNSFIYNVSMNVGIPVIYVYVRYIENKKRDNITLTHIMKSLVLF